MAAFCVYVQEGFGVEGHAVYFTNEAPVYEAESIPVFAVANDDPSKKVHVGDREEMFVNFTPLNGPMRQRGKINRVPFQRLLAVVKQDDDSERDDENV